MTQSEIQIAPAIGKHVPDLVRFACAMAMETEHKRLDPAVVEQGVQGVLDQPSRGRYLVAHQGGALLGTLMLTYEWSDWRCAEWWWIQSVYVEPSARRLGVFRALYAHVLAEAEARGDICGVRLYVEQDNQRAQQTYAALGMRDAAYRVMEHAFTWADERVGKIP
ncbi:GNAT family N-acetyltransferase [Pseudomarimonas salicorniae]|uniref:GNAT family N-acetyltransferase n=1 Tax=Pseudomarimonas salicorniae TaxID=2933270 RepID=A0ABT0GGB1_9GAMM|nr:GNAT family N-acetyltransferase [Lysobacter sp. CAU 1642]MCK7593575.1 GNAT family N-acetyltransferase [Lysobacter sp. CAU 1642]